MGPTKKRTDEPYEGRPRFEKAKIQELKSNDAQKILK